MPYEGEFAHYKPLKRIVESQQVQALTGRMRIKASTQSDITLTPPVNLSDLATSEWTPDYVIAIDSGGQPTAVKNGYPGASIGYLTVASVLLDFKKMIYLDSQRPADPKEFRTIERAESIEGAIPCSNVVIDDEQDTESSFRRVLFETFKNNRVAEGGESILDTYEAITDNYQVYRAGDPDRGLPACPHEDCLRVGKRYAYGHSEYVCQCNLRRRLFSTDALRIHEALNPESLNEAVITQTTNVLERLWVIHFLRTLEKQEMLPVLQRLAIVVDGPLAVFDEPAWISQAISGELKRLNQVAKQVIGNHFDLLLLGIEKTGRFMDHFVERDKGPEGGQDWLPRQSALLLSDPYIKSNIIFSKSTKPYGRGTYFGRKVLYKTRTGALIVANLPYLTEDDEDLSCAEPRQFPRLSDTMRMLDVLVSARYRNSLMPIVSAHAEAAIPMNLGKRVLERIARELMQQSKQR